MPDEKLLMAWLRDAHAMEESLIPILEAHAKESSEHPQVEARVRRHIEETKRHAELVRGCLERHGGKPSKSKDVAGKLLGGLGAPSTAFFRDRLMKNALVDYAVEHFEIACYTALRIAAEKIGDDETARVCEEILAEERDMAGFLEEPVLPHVVRVALV